MTENRFEQYARIAAVALLAIACFLIIQPFLGAIIFAGVLCFSTWPLFERLRARLGGRSWLASLIVVTILVIAIALPIALAAQSIVVHSSEAVESIRGFLDRKATFELPAFIRDIPGLGPWLDGYLRGILGSSGSDLAAYARQLLEPARGLLVTLGKAAGQGLIQVLIAIFVSYFFYREGDRMRRLLMEGMVRLAGPEKGMVLIGTAQAAVKGVVYGLIGTAFAQAVVALIGFWIAGVPGAMILAALTFLLSLVPMGPVLVWGGAAAWLYFHSGSGWALFMVIYGVAIISSVDNFVKPILMSRAGNLSMLLVVLGVFGGAVAFGFIGLFVGPALLAIAWNLMKAWLEMPDDGIIAREPQGPPR
jgi:predicted PurR-regulated permease PerM